MTYTHAKRLRVVTEGKVYRSGCMTAEGFADAVKKFGIRTIINLRDEAPEPRSAAKTTSIGTRSPRSSCARIWT